MEKRTVSLHFLNGFKRLKKEVKAFVGAVSIMSRLTEGALWSLLDDPGCASPTRTYGAQSPEECCGYLVARGDLEEPLT
jgi:hypothetical protein